MEHNLRRRVLVEIETSLAPGRDMLRGIAKFVREIHTWDVHHSAGHWSLRGDIESPSRAGDEQIEPGLDGIITRIFDGQSERAALTSIARGVPVVDVLGDGPGDGVPLVHTDDRAIGTMAARHLHAQGFRRFAFCGIAATRWSVRRCEGFRDALGMPDIPVLEFDKSGDMGAGEADTERAERWLASLEKPTGIFVSCDHIAPLLLESCPGLGITVPEQVALVGVNNDTVACNICHPTLSSIDGSHTEIGYRAARLLNDMIDGHAPPDGPTFIPPSQLVIRDSSGQTMIEDPVIARAARFILRNAAGAIGVDEVAAEVALSRRELQRRFPLATGRTVQDTLINARIQIAKRLLQSGEYTIDAIAQMSGFGSRQHFAQTFRARTGSTPATYRKNISQ